MESDLRAQLVGAMLRLKKMEASFTGECGMQLNELSILKSIAGGCACDDCAGMNLDVAGLQARLRISKPGISYILNTLEKKAYITREIDPSDRRKIAIRITDAGRTATVEALQRYDLLWEDFLSRYGELEMRALVDLLLRLDEIGLPCPGDAGGQ